jgi:hypothetical protein
MTLLDYGIRNKKGFPMLETTQWVRINKQCHTLVDENNKVLAAIYTSYNESDGDENYIWKVEIQDEEFGSYVSLYSAKLAVQEAIADCDARRAASKKRAKAKKEKKEVEKKVGVGKRK